MSEISNNHLDIDSIPKPEAGWNEIGWFSLTFNGYDFHGGIDTCGEIANRWLRDFENDGGLPSTLNDLRTCLFFEQRRWRHYGYAPDEKAMCYIRGLVRSIRTKAKIKETIHLQVDISNS